MRVPSSWSGIVTVAGLAFRESARSRVLHALIAAMVLAVGVAYLFAWIAGGDADQFRQSKVVLDLSLSAIVILGTLAAIFLGTNLVYAEVQRRTIYSVLARPVTRGRFLIGKFLGLIAVLGLAVFAMGAILLAGLKLGGGTVTGALLAAILMTYVELCVIASVALLFAVVAHPIEGAVFSFVVVAAGHATESLRDLTSSLARGKDAEALSFRALDALTTAVYYVFPNLENFNLRTHAAHQLKIDPFWVTSSLGYAAVYVSIMLALACLAFRRRPL